MALFGGRSYRPGKRSSSSSSCVSTASLIMFLGFCVLGVWVMTSSSVVPSEILRNWSRDDGKSSSSPRSELLVEDATSDLESRNDAVSFEENSVVEAIEEKVQLVKEEPEQKQTEVPEELEENQTVTDQEDDKKQIEVSLESEEQKTLIEKVDDKKQTKAEGEKKQTKVEGEKKQIKAEGDDDNKLESVTDKNSEIEHKVVESEVKQEEQPSSATDKDNSDSKGQSGEVVIIAAQNWELCNVTADTDYIPCLDNEKGLKSVRNTGHYEHRERHCPAEGPKCLVPLPKGYKPSIEWPRSRDEVILSVMLSLTLSCFLRSNIVFIFT